MDKALCKLWIFPHQAQSTLTASQRLCSEMTYTLTLEQNNLEPGSRDTSEAAIGRGRTGILRLDWC